MLEFIIGCSAIGLSVYGVHDMYKNPEKRKSMTIIAVVIFFIFQISGIKPPSFRR